MASADEDGHRFHEGAGNGSVPAGGTSVRRTRSQEAVKTLLSSFGEDVDSVEFANHDVRFRDLSALSNGDLTLLGVSNADTQSAMLETFQELPNQEVHYDRYITYTALCFVIICNQPGRFCSTTEAQKYNGSVLDRAESHLDSMNSSLSAAYLKMLVNPSKDVIVDDSIFASRFVIEALEELKKTTDDLEERLRTLEKIAARNAKLQLSNSAERHFYKTVIIGGLFAGASIALWVWKSR